MCYCVWINLDKEQIWEAKKAEMVYIELVDEDVETLMH